MIEGVEKLAETQTMHRLQLKQFEFGIRNLPANYTNLHDFFVFIRLDYDYLRTILNYLGLFV